MTTSPLGDPSDEEVVSRVLGGDREAFATIVRRYERRLKRIGMGFVKDQDDAADFAQDVLLRAYAALEAFAGRAKFSTWLYRIAYNTGINSTRKRGRFEALDEEASIPDDEPGTEERFIREESAAALREAMKDLPERYALCIEMFFYYELQYDEISVITGFPVNTIKSHVFRAKKILKDSIETEHDDRGARL